MSIQCISAMLLWFVGLNYHHFMGLREFFYESLSKLFSLTWWEASDCRRSTDQSSSSFHHSPHAKGADSASALLVWPSLTFYTSLERRRVMQRTHSWRQKSIPSVCSATGPCAATATWAIVTPKSHTCLAGSEASGPCVVSVCVWVCVCFKKRRKRLGMCFLC